MSLPPTISISTLYEPKSSSTQLSLGPSFSFWTVVLKGFCELHCSQAAGGTYLPLLILFSCLLSPFLCACVFPFLLIFLLLFLLSLSVPALLNISSYVSDTFAKISWTATEEQQDSQLYVAYMNNRKLLFLSLPCKTLIGIFRWHHV